MRVPLGLVWLLAIVVSWAVVGMIVLAIAVALGWLL